MAFWIPWVIDAIAAAVLVVFFFWGISDGSVSSFNIALWLSILAAVGGVVGGSFWLRSKGKHGPAIAVAWLLAVPTLMFFLLMAAFLVLQPDFR